MIRMEKMLLSFYAQRFGYLHMCVLAAISNTNIDCHKPPLLWLDGDRGPYLALMYSNFGQHECLCQYDVVRCNATFENINFAS